MSTKTFKCYATCLALLLMGQSASAQTTAFTYQGKLTDAGNPANGTYDMLFKLFNTPTVGTGTQQGSTITNESVQVAAGNFTVTLDFGSPVFDGTARYLEISVRPMGNPNPHTILAPRQPITSSPYAIQTINTQQLGGLPASRYVAADAGGNVGIGTSIPASKLDVRGNLTLDAGTSPVLYASTAGSEQNRYLQLINSPSFSSASGLKAGGVLVADSYGFANPGKNDLIVKGNVGIGTDSPQSILSVQTSSLSYGLTHTNGTVTVGSYVDSTGGWLGTRTDHPLRFFTNDSSALMTIDTTGSVAIGTTPDLLQKLVVQSSVSGGSAVVGIQTGSGAAIWGINTTGFAGLFNGKVNISDNTLTLQVLGPAGSQSLCRNNLNEVATCSSSLRYKKDIQPFGGGLSFINQLRPIAFKWKANDGNDIGFGAEDVARIDPLFVTYNKQGEIEGVKYDRLSVVFVNAFKEQQAQIEKQDRQIENQQAQIERQQREIAELRQAVNALRPTPRARSHRRR